MELVHFLRSNLVSVTLVTLLFFTLLWKTCGKQSKFDRLPPGPSPLPLLGNLLQMDIKAPYRYYHEMSRKYGSVFTVWLGSSPAVVISGYQALREAFINQGEEFSGRANYPMLMTVTKGYGLLVSNGQRSKDLRRFSLATLKNFGMGRRSIEERIREEAREMVKAFENTKGSAVDPHGTMCRSVSNVICSIVFGHRFEYEDAKFADLLNAVESYFKVLSSPVGMLYNMFPWIVSCFPGKHKDMFLAVKKTLNYFREEADRRFKKMDFSDPQDYIEAFLVKMKEDKNQTEFHYENLICTIWSLFAAGTSTTTNVLKQLILMMIKFPHIQERVQREIDDVIGCGRMPQVDDRSKMSYTNAVIHETQRFMDLTPTSVPHKVIRDTEFHNYLIPAGTMVLPLLSSVLCDPELFKNPLEFDPHNFLDENGLFKKNNDGFAAFGIGKRSCIGEALAQMEIFLFFTSLVQRFTLSGTVSPEDIDITPACASFGRRPPLFQCHVKPRHKDARSDF